MLPPYLEDWLTDEGDRVCRVQQAKLPLSTTDRVIYEIWLLDTEARNGGLSQYFANRGKPQWQSCCRAASMGMTPSFAPFAAEVDRILGNGRDPYEAINSRGRIAEELWEEYDVAVVSELKAACQRVS